MNKTEVDALGLELDQAAKHMLWCAYSVALAAEAGRIDTEDVAEFTAARAACDTAEKAWSDAWLLSRASA